MSILQEIEAEVQAAADGMSVEIILMLLDKMDAEYAQRLAAGKISTQEALKYYVLLKIGAHHLKRRIDDENFYHYDRIRHTPIQEQINRAQGSLFILENKIKSARREYYVAKRRSEGEHRADCDCRGCRCLKELDVIGAQPIGVGVDGTRAGQTS